MLALQKAERESPGHYMPGMNRRSFEGERRGKCGHGKRLTRNAWHDIIRTDILQRS